MRHWWVAVVFMLLVSGCSTNPVLLALLKAQPVQPAAVVVGGARSQPVRLAVVLGLRAARPAAGRGYERTRAEGAPAQHGAGDGFAVAHDLSSPSTPAGVND